MPVKRWVEEYIVNPLTYGNQGLLRDTSNVLVDLKSPDALVSPAPPIESHLAPLRSYIQSALQDNSELRDALVSLRNITNENEQIDLSTLLRDPQELFMAESEWECAETSVKMERARLATHATEADDAMEIVEDDVPTYHDQSSPLGVNAAVNATIGQVEIIQQSLLVAANSLLALNERLRQQTRSLGTPTNTDGVTTEEDPEMKKIRLNLLAVAKRAPIDKIARLPAALVPPHIRHIVPTLPS